MQWASAISCESNLATAMTELKRELVEQLGSTRPDLVCAFVSQGYEGDYEQIPDLVRQHLAPGALIGCTAMGVIGAGREIEQHIAEQSALSLTAALLPEVDLYSFHLEAADLPDPDAGPEEWANTLKVPREPAAHFILLADMGGPPPFDPRPLLMGLDFAYGDSTKMGGLASAMEDNYLFLDRAALTSGLVGVALQGNVAVDTIVAQGCRPIGEPMTITECNMNILLELDQRPAAQVLMELYESLSPEDQKLMSRPYALHLGIASTEFQDEFKQGDFLIRNLEAMNLEKGFISIGDILRQGQTVQFHLRDADAAATDLDLMLGRHQSQSVPTEPAGALLFTCNGRGQLFFGRNNHDSDLFANSMGEIPLGGFFCGGEIGQVGPSTYLHGYTSSFGIFRPLQA